MKKSLLRLLSLTFAVIIALSSFPGTIALNAAAEDSATPIDSDATSSRLIATDAGYIRGGDANKTVPQRLNSSSCIEVKGINDSATDLKDASERIGYIKFDISSLAGKKFDSAVLSLSFQENITDRAYDIYLAKNSEWDGATITADNAPPILSESYSMKAVTLNNNQNTVDISELVETALWENQSDLTLIITTRRDIFGSNGSQTQIKYTDDDKPTLSVANIADSVNMRFTATDGKHVKGGNQADNNQSLYNDKFVEIKATDNNATVASNETERIAYFKFNIADLAGKNFASAILNLPFKENITDRYYDIYLAKDSEWDGATITANNAPPILSESYSMKEVTLNKGACTVDISNLVRAAISLNQSDLTLMITTRLEILGTNGSQTLIEYSDAAKPTLSVTDIVVDPNFKPIVKTVYAATDGGFTKGGTESGTTHTANGYLELKALDNIATALESVTERIAYVKFDISDLKGKDFDAAILSLSFYENIKQRGYDIFLASSSDWSGSSITANNAPKVWSEEFSLSNAVLNNDKNTVDISELVKAAIALNQSEMTLMFTSRKDIFGTNPSFTGITYSATAKPTIEIIDIVDATDTTPIINEFYTPTAGGYVKGGNKAGTHQAVNGVLEIKAEDNDSTTVSTEYERITYLKFDISNLEGKDFSSAALSLPFTSNYSDRAYDIYLAENSEWDDATITANNAPGVMSNTDHISGASFINTTYSVDVAALIKEAIAADQSDMTLIISTRKDIFGANDSQTQIKYTDSIKPYLTITGIVDTILPEGTERFTAADGGYVKGDTEAGNHQNANGFLEVKATDNIATTLTNITERIAYLKFDISSLAGKIIDSAVLKLSFAENITDRAYDIYLAENSEWDGATITANNAPDVLGEIYSLKSVTINNNARTADVSGLIKSAIDAGQSTVTLLITTRYEIFGTNHSQTRIKYTDNIKPTLTVSGIADGHSHGVIFTDSDAKPLCSECANYGIVSIVKDRLPDVRDGFEVINVGDAEKYWFSTDVGFDGLNVHGNVITLGDVVILRAENSSLMAGDLKVDGLKTVDVRQVSVEISHNFYTLYVDGVKAISAPCSNANTVTLGDEAFGGCVKFLYNKAVILGETDTPAVPSYATSTENTECTHAGSHYNASVENGKLIFSCANCGEKVYEATAEQDVEAALANRSFDLRDKISIIEFTTKAVEAVTAGDLLSVKRYGKDDLKLLTVDENGNLCTVGGSALYDKQGEPYSLINGTFDIVAVYDDEYGYARYYVNGAIAHLNDGTTAICKVSPEGSECGITVNSDLVADGYSCTSTKPSDIFNYIGIQVHYISDQIRILSGIDSLWYDAVGYEVAIYDENDKLVSTPKTVEGYSVYSSVDADGNEVKASFYGYNLFAPLTITNTEEATVGSTLAVIPYVKVGGVTYKGNQVSILVTESRFEATESVKIRVATANVGDFTGNNDEATPIATQSATLAAMNADIIATQEFLADRPEGFYPNYSYTERQGDSDDNYAFLSSYALNGAEKVYYDFDALGNNKTISEEPQKTLMDVITNPFFLYSNVDVGGYTVHLINIKTEQFDRDARRAQLEYVLDYVDTNELEYVIILGSFNSGDYEAFWNSETESMDYTLVSTDSLHEEDLLMFTQRPEDKISFKAANAGEYGVLNTTLENGGIYKELPSAWDNILVSSNMNITNVDAVAESWMNHRAFLATDIEIVKYNETTALPEFTCEGHSLKDLAYENSALTMYCEDCEKTVTVTSRIAVEKQNINGGEAFTEQINISTSSSVVSTNNKTGYAVRFNYKLDEIIPPKDANGVSIFSVTAPYNNTWYTPIFLREYPRANDIIVRLYKDTNAPAFIIDDASKTYEIIVVVDIQNENGKTEHSVYVDGKYIGSYEQPEENLSIIPAGAESYNFRFYDGQKNLSPSHVTDFEVLRLSGDLKINDEVYVDPNLTNKCNGHTLCSPVYENSTVTMYCKDCGENITVASEVAVEKKDANGGESFTEEITFPTSTTVISTTNPYGYVVSFNYRANTVTPTEEANGVSILSAISSYEGSWPIVTFLRQYNVGGDVLVRIGNSTSAPGFILEENKDYNFFILVNNNDKSTNYSVYINGEFFDSFSDRTIPPLATNCYFRINDKSKNKCDASVTDFEVLYLNGEFNINEDPDPWVKAEEDVTTWFARWETIKATVGDNNPDRLDYGDYKTDVLPGTINKYPTNSYYEYYKVSRYYKKDKKNEDGSWGDWTTEASRLIDHLKNYKYNDSETTLYNQYGGYTGVGPIGEAKGYFYTLEDKINGRWWTVDPEGYPFYRTAVVEVAGGVSPVQKENVLAKHGTIEAWAESATARLRELGFNATGAWSDLANLSAVSESAPLVQTKNLSVLARYGSKVGINITSGGSTEFTGGIMPVFDPAFERFANSHVASQTSDYRTNPFIYGWMSDNELPDSKFMLTNTLFGEGISTDSKFAYSYAVAVTFAERKTGKDISNITESDITEDLEKEYKAMVYDKYFEVVTGALDKFAPNHLYLGCRFLPYNYKSEEIMRVSGYWCDIISINYYGAWTPNPDLTENWMAWSGKPYIITEWYAMSPDTGLACNSGAGWVVLSQEDRADFYQNYALGLIEHKGCVGFDWFKYWDNDPTDLEGIANDSSNTDGNKGIYNTAYEEYELLVEAMEKVNKNKYSLISFFDARNPG